MRLLSWISMISIRQYYTFANPQLYLEIVIGLNEPSNVGILNCLVLGPVVVFDIPWLELEIVCHQGFYSRPD